MCKHCVGTLSEVSPRPTPSVIQRRSCFPETEEKVKHLKRKNAELAVIAKRLEERARKLQEANLKVVSAEPLPCWAGAWGRRAPCPQELLFFAFVGTERPPLSSLINLARPCAKFALYNSDRAKTTKLN